ncbi:transmembrane protein PVRIG isoform X6 [Equus asinus]|uniref:transmembrane protein PVRIG isoform X6 n=1 Tax=Equus asinus TaxID=9793 RepID=UPI0038F61667
MGQSSVWGVLVTLGIQETMLSGAAGCARLEGLAGYPQTALGKEPQPPALLTLKHGMETGKPCHCHFKSPEEGGPSPTAHHTEVSERRKWGRVWRTPSPAAPPACSHLQTSCNETGNRCRPHHHSPQSLGQRGAMDRPRALLLLLALLTLCITAGTPKVWVQVQTEAAKSPSFTVRCGFLGSGSISLVTVSCGKPDGAEGASLAVLHPEFGTELKAPARQAHWETKTSISLTLEGSEGRSPSPNTTFCCNPRRAGRPGWDLGSLGGPSLWLLLPPPPPAPAEALVCHEASATPQQPPDTDASKGGRPSLPGLSPHPLCHGQHQLLLPSNSGHRPPAPAAVKVGAAPHPQDTPTPGTCPLGIPASLCSQQFHLR